MKKILILSLIFAPFSCKPQNREQMEVEKVKHYKMEHKHEYNKLINKDFESFDIKRFDSRKDEAEDYVYFLDDGSRVREFGDVESGYFLQVTSKNSYYTISKGFYPNSNIKSKGPSFKDNCEIGIWYDYDEKGNLIKETDMDKLYNVKIEDIIRLLKEKKANFQSNFFNINRNIDEKTHTGNWSLSYEGEYKNDIGRFLMHIDDKTSEIVWVAKILGKEGEKQILFDKQNKNR